ncbi:hypothetical protein TNCV_3891401 [Trichonephila clavipes]|nr:hypothetical protein TNCV_3891401 [Trichonephila clavipes]
MDFVILNHDQLTRTIPELATPSNFPTTPKRGRLSLKRFIASLSDGFSTVIGMTHRPRVRYVDRMGFKAADND